MEALEGQIRDYQSSFRKRRSVIYQIFMLLELQAESEYTNYKKQFTNIKQRI